MLNCAVLLATYNGEPYIKEQIDSIINQENVNLKIFISDDDSTDETIQKIREYHTDKIVLLPSIGRIGSAAKNFFRLFRDVDFSSFDYIALADQDDIWKLDKLRNAILKIKQNNQDAYSSNVVAFWENGKTCLIHKSKKEVKWGYLFSSAGPGCTYVFTKQLALSFQHELKMKKSLSEKIQLHDWLFYAYAKSKGNRWIVDERPSMYYRQHDTNVFGANIGIETFISRWRQARNGWYRSQILAIASFCSETNSLPIKYLQRNKYIDRIKLSIIVFQLRKKKIEACFLALVLLIPGFT